MLILNWYSHDYAEDDSNGRYLLFTALIILAIILITLIIDILQLIIRLNFIGIVIIIL